MSTNIDNHPMVLPENYRAVYVFFFFPVRVNGVLRRSEWVRVIQRCIPDDDHYPDGWEWVDVGFWDEVIGDLRKPPFVEEV